MVVVAGLAVALAGGARLAAGQNMPTAKGPDSYLAFGGEVTAFQADYGKRLLGGGTVYGDLNMTWRYGVESEARYLRIHTDEDVTQTDYLVGPRVMFRPGRFRPYAKFLVGAGRMTFPFHYADGTFFVYAPGGWGGLDPGGSGNVSGGGFRVPDVAIVWGVGGAAAVRVECGD